MNMLALHPKPRVFVLLGAHSMVLFVGRVDALGRWRLLEGEIVAIPGELRADHLTRHLSDFRQAKKLQIGAAVHWFLPPDMLSVVWVPKDAAQQGLVLPFPAEQVQAGVLGGDDHGQVWLWMHQTWLTLLSRAADNARLHSLYVHPRQWLFQQPDPMVVAGKGSAPLDAWRVVHDGSYRHVFCGKLMLRSIALDENHTPESSDLRLKLELDALVSARSEPSRRSLMLQGVQISVRNIDQELSVATSGAKKSPSAVPPYSPQELHRSGLMVGSLTRYTEARVWGLTALVLAALALVGGAMALQYRQADSLIDASAQELKVFAPEARKLADLRLTLAQREGLLKVNSQVAALPNALATLGTLSEGLPTPLTLQAVRLSAEALDLRVSAAPNAQEFTPDWPPQVASYGNFVSVKADNDSSGRGRVWAYTAQARPHTP